jgi:phage terminase large subunit-like protein
VVEMMGGQRARIRLMPSSLIDPGERSLTPEAYYYDEEAAERVIRFIETSIKLFEGQFNNRPMILLDWQKDRLFRPLFGVKCKADGLRRYRKFLLFVPRKNGKTGIVIALSLVMMLIDRENGAEINLIANSREQMQDVFRGAAEIVKKNPKLAKAITVGTKTYTHHKSASVIRILPAKAASLDGRKTHLGIQEESHECEDPQVWYKMDTSTGSRVQPILGMITTAGEYDEENIAVKEVAYAEKVLAGTVQDDEYLPILYRADKTDDPFAEETQRKANPSIGVSPSWSVIRSAANRAKAEPSFLPIYLRYHLNVWTNSDTVWMPLHVWDACTQPLELDALEGQVCYAGLDMSSTTDLTALVLSFPVLKYAKPHYALLPFLWIPADNLADKARQDKADYALWLRMYPQQVFATEGNKVDHETVLNTIDNLRRRFKIRQLMFDRWNIGEIDQKVERMGIKPVEFGQGFQSMSEPTKMFYALALDKRIIHGGNLILRHQVQNCISVMDDAENIKLSKKRSTGRIDSIIGSIMGLDGAVRAGAKPKSSIFKNGLTMLK